MSIVTDVPSPITTSSVDVGRVPPHVAGLLHAPFETDVTVTIDFEVDILSVLVPSGKNGFDEEVKARSLLEENGNCAFAAEEITSRTRAKNETYPRFREDTIFPIA